MRIFIKQAIISGVLLLGSVSSIAHALPAQKKHLSIEDAVLLTIKNNPSLISARLDDVTKTYSNTTLMMSYYPNPSALDITATKSFMSSSSGTTGTTYTSTSGINWGSIIGTNFNYTISKTTNKKPEHTFTVSQPLLRNLFTNSTKVNYENAKDTLIINKLELENTFSQTLNKTITKYLNLINIQHTINLNNIALDEAKKLLDKTISQVEVGSMPKSNITEQEINLIAAQLSLDDAHTSFAKAQESFSLDLGLNPKTKLTFDQDSAIFKPKRRSIGHYTDSALKNNFSLVQMKNQKQAAIRSYDLAKNQMLWKLDANASLKRQDNKTLNKQGTISLSIPLFRRTLEESLLTAKNSLKKTNIQLTDLEHQVRTKTIELYQSMISLEKKMILQQKQIQLQQNNYDISVIQHLHGKGSAFEINTKFKNLVNSKTTLINTKNLYATTYFDLLNQTGEFMNFWVKHLKNIDYRHPN